jgi:hypothetical protein
MTKATVLERMQLLKDQRERVVIDVHALSGAIQDCEFWIAQLSQPDQESTDADSATPVPAGS